MTREGRFLRRGAVIRSDALERLTAAGWEALAEAGVRTVIDLREAAECGPDRAARPEDLTTLRTPLYEGTDEAFVAEWAGGADSTPLYYLPYLREFPERIAAVISALVAAPPGGIVVHCRLGRDRTGLVVAVLLSLLRVEEAEILADYAYSDRCLAPSFAARGELDIVELAEAVLEERGRTAADVLRELLEVDMASYLRDAGVTDEEIERLRNRFLEV
jgi:protein-tyrosine phosphatase